MSHSVCSNKYDWWVYIPFGQILFIFDPIHCLILHRKATENLFYPNLPIIHILKSLLDQKQLGCSVFMVICVPDTVVNVTEPSFEK